MSKIGTHFKNNKKTYIACGVTAAVVGAGTYCIFGTPRVTISKSQIMQILSWKPVASIEVYVEALGDPGNIIQDVTDGVSGTIWASQGQAARALGAHASQVSRHLHGELPDVNGHILKRLGKAIVAPLAESQV